MSTQKYKNIHIVVDGVTFDSKNEALSRLKRAIVEAQYGIRIEVI